MKTLDRKFWDERYASGKTGWDIGYASKPLTTYIDQLEDLNLNILIPGAGNGYEVIYLLEKGFKNLTVIDISTAAIKNIGKKLPEGHSVTLIRDDYFNHKGSYDIILEQTFFCALLPELRNRYISHSHSLLNDHGYIVGLLFNIVFDREGPPYGGNQEEYKQLFREFFTIKYCDPCYNSIAPRAGSEVFIKFIKKT
ncbi:MAG: methyltransferase domain-containing protein [Saprospiraceae bacterium]|nr:methyltransferase domain-containing protein [Saprospiraceae bacterium]